MRRESKSIKAEYETIAAESREINKTLAIIAAFTAAGAFVGSSIPVVGTFLGGVAGFSVGAIVEKLRKGSYFMFRSTLKSHADHRRAPERIPSPKRSRRNEELDRMMGRIKAAREEERKTFLADLPK